MRVVGVTPLRRVRAFAIVTVLLVLSSGVQQSQELFADRQGATLRRRAFMGWLELHGCNLSQVTLAQVSRRDDGFSTGDLSLTCKKLTIDCM